MLPTAETKKAASSTFSLFSFMLLSSIGWVELAQGQESNLLGTSADLANTDS